MTTADKIRRELADHIQETAGDPTPEAVPEVVHQRGDDTGGADAIPEGLVGEVILRVHRDPGGAVIGWETTTPGNLADAIDRVDDPEVDQGEADILSAGQLSRWRNEGRDL